jgi:hypothetical protein
MRTRLAVGPLAPEAAARDVDDRRVDASNLVKVDAKFGPRLRQQVGQEDIATPDEFLKHRPRLVERERQADAALAAIGRFDHGGERHTRRGGGVTGHGHESSLGVTRHRILDLDDVRTPVCKHGSR